MMHYPLLAALLHPLLYSLLIDSLSEYDAISSLSCLASSCVFKYDAIFFPRCLASSCARSLLNPYNNMIRYPILAALPFSASFLLKTYSNMMHYPLLAALLHPLLCSFLIESLPKYDAISSPNCLASVCASFLLNPYSNRVRHPLLAALPPPVLVYY
jgi:hypothetical protein